MRPEDFERMVRRMEQEVPAEFLAGVAEIAVSPRTVPHPTREDIFTLGECIPLPALDGGAEGIQSRVVLYYGSFRALASLAPGFDWRAEAWETLTHELRHHLEWRARAPDLEAYDRAAEHNFARQDGEPFDPLFFLDGEPAGDDRYRVDDDVFIDDSVGGIVLPDAGYHDAMRELTQAGWQPDYIEVRSREDLALAKPGEKHLVVLGAARLGATRLIDNLEV